MRKYVFAVLTAVCVVSLGSVFAADAWKDKVSTMTQEYPEEIERDNLFRELVDKAVPELARGVYEGSQAARLKAEAIAKDLGTLQAWYNAQMEEAAPSVTLANGYRLNREQVQYLIDDFDVILKKRSARDATERRYFKTLVRSANAAEANAVAFAKLNLGVGKITALIDSFDPLQVGDTVRVYFNESGEVVKVIFHDTILGTEGAHIRCLDANNAPIMATEGGQVYRVHFVRSTRPDVPRQNCLAELDPDADMRVDKSGDAYKEATLVGVEDLPALQPGKMMRNPFAKGMLALEKATATEAGLVKTTEALGQVVETVSAVGEVAEAAQTSAAQAQASANSAHYRLNNAYTDDKVIIRGGFRSTQRRLITPDGSSCCGE